MYPIQKWMIPPIIVGLALVIVGIWTGDWRWVATGLVVGLPALCVWLGAAL